MTMKREDALKLVERGIKQLNDALAEGRSEELTKYLAAMGRFHRYSFNNVMMILTQMPEALHVAGIQAWNQLGRSVKKGESGIAILAPLRFRKKAEDEEDGEEKVGVRGFRVVYVYDVSQTEGDELPTMASVIGEPGDNFARLERVVEDYGIQLEYDILPPGTMGLSAGGTIRLRPELPPVEAFAVLVHETAHELVHHSEGRLKETTKTVRETEAEAIAAVVCQAFGLDSTTRSADYINLHRGDTDLLSESLEYVRKASAKLIADIQAVQLEEQPQAAPSSAPACEHTLHGTSENGTLQGSWVLVDASWELDDEDHGQKVQCGVCGKFYGYIQQPMEQTAELVASNDEPEDAAEQEEQPVYRTGRADYEDRKAARMERYQDRAERQHDDANATHQRARSMASVIPFGQPILVGHHSERRDRNYRERIHNTFGKAFDLEKKAKYWDQRAAAAESSTAISSDDPEAIPKLEEKLECLEHSHEVMKAVNASWRRAGKPSPEDADAWQKVKDDPTVELTDEQIDAVRLDFARFIRMHSSPFPPYALQNSSANIRRVRERIEQMKASANAEHVEEKHGDLKYVENVDENRVQLIFPGKPPKETRELLKQNGFRWSRYNTAWQRLLNDQGQRAARYVIAQLQQDDTAETQTQNEEVPA